MVEMNISSSFGWLIQFQIYLMLEHFYLVNLSVKRLLVFYRVFRIMLLSTNVPPLNSFLARTRFAHEKQMEHVTILLVGGVYFIQRKHCISSYFKDSKW